MSITHLFTVADSKCQTGKKACPENLGRYIPYCAISFLLFPPRPLIIYLLFIVLSTGVALANQSIIHQQQFDVVQQPLKVKLEPGKQQQFFFASDARETAPQPRGTSAVCTRPACACSGQERQETIFENQEKQWESKPILFIGRHPKKQKNTSQTPSTA